MGKKQLRAIDIRNKDDLIVIGGGGGFIGGSLARYFHDQGFTRIRAVDKKPLPEWYQRVPGVECLCLDLSESDNCVRACEGATEVYNLAADMGGMGFIERFRIECLRSILINTHMFEAAYRAGADRCRARDEPQPAGCPILDSTETFSYSFVPGDYFLYIDSFYPTGNVDGRDSGPYTLEVTGSLPVELLDFTIE